MKALSVEAVFFCLGTGVLLGALFLLLKLGKCLLGLGKWGEAFLDILYCLLGAGVVFLSALAVDKGRLRVAQLLLQGIGAWAFLAALDPFLCGAVAFLEKIIGQVFGFWKRKWRALASHFPRKTKKIKAKRKKTGRKKKKDAKST